MRKALLAAALTLSVAPAAHAARPLRLAYASDWAGPIRTYVADPTTGKVIGQLTPQVNGCTAFDVQLSPDGQHVLFWSRCATASTLIVAAPSGRPERRLAYAPTCGGCTAVWAPDSKHIAYERDQVAHVTTITGAHDHVVNVAFPSRHLTWSPDSKALALEDTRGQLVVWRSGAVHTIGFAADYAWHPSSRWIAYADPRGNAMVLATPDGRARRQLTSGYYGFDLAWSAAGNFLAFVGADGIGLLDLKGDTTRTLPFGRYANRPTWAPRGAKLAVNGEDGIGLFDAATGAARLLSADRARELAWSPDGRRLAYIAMHPEVFSLFGAGSLRTVDLAGTVRTLVAATDDFGGAMFGLTWARPPKHARYRKPVMRSLATVSPDELQAPWPITRLAADGDHVAYVSCGHVFVWSPARMHVVQAEPVASLMVQCTLNGDYIPYWIYSLAVADNRAAFGALEGNMGQWWGLFSGTLPQQRWSELASVGLANSCSNLGAGIGDLVGSGSLLVFSKWRDTTQCPPRTLHQTIYRVDATGCPCPAIAESPGPLVPFDSATGRVVVVGENATEVLDADGKVALSIPVAALAAQLTDSDVLLLLRGELRDYDASTGGLLHTWPLPDVPSSGECGSPHGAWECHYDARLVLDDAANGLVAYVLDRQVHLLRLVDGKDSVIAPGTFARFIDLGLVYADGSRIHLVPYAKLPLLSFTADRS